MNYPARIIKMGETDRSIVIAVRRRLNELFGDSSLALDPEKAVFDAEMKQAIRLFQARHVDGEGRPLKQDGEIGPITWAALFGVATIATSAPATAFLAEVLRIAAAEEAKLVREQPRNSNRGPQVNEYLRRVGVSPGKAWCCAFVYFCFEEAARQAGTQRENPMVKTAGCLDHWNRAVTKGAKRIRAADAVQNPGLLQPGMIFIMDHGAGLGHTGLIERMSGGLLTTIEGNTDASKTREGGGVYRLTRKINEVNKGFISYS